MQKQHALKGQKLLAQGSALGMMTVSKAPCKGKSFKRYYKHHAQQGQKPIQAARPERAEALSPGQRPGYDDSQQGAL